MAEATMADYEADKVAGFPGYQQQQLVDIFNRAKTYDQAQKDVAAARAMMGSVRVQQAIAKGTDPAAAYYSNINYFVNDKNLAPVMNALRPVPPPYATNFPGISAPVVIAPTRSGQTVRFPPASALPPKPNTLNAPVPVQPFTMPDGTKIPGWFAVVGPDGRPIGHPFKDAGNAPSALSIPDREDKSELKDQIKQLEKTLPETPPSEKRFFGMSPNPAFQTYKDTTNKVAQLKAQKAAIVNKYRPAQQSPVNAQAPDILAEAQAAIQRGADPAKVKARLKSMGIEVQE